MGFISSIYLMLALFTGVSGMWHGDFWPGLAGTLAPMLAFVAGGGITSAQRDPRDSNPIVVAIFGGIILIIAAYWIGRTGWSVRLGEVHFSGVVWCLIGFGIGLTWGRRERV